MCTLCGEKSRAARLKLKVFFRTRRHGRTVDAPLPCRRRHGRGESVEVHSLDMALKSTLSGGRCFCTILCCKFSFVELQKERAKIAVKNLHVALVSTKYMEVGEAPLGSLH